jgi:hypothetical protein
MLYFKFEQLKTTAHSKGVAEVWGKATLRTYWINESIPDLCIMINYPNHPSPYTLGFFSKQLAHFYGSLLSTSLPLQK